jgi:hypothetical protein
MNKLQGKMAQLSPTQKKEIEEVCLNLDLLNFFYLSHLNNHHVGSFSIFNSCGPN